MAAQAQATPGDIDAVKKWLNRGRGIDKEIRSLMIAKAAAELRATNITSRAREKVTTKSRGRRDDALIILAEISADIDAQLARINPILVEIAEVIFSVDNTTYRTLLIQRYMLFRPWNEIALEMHYSPQHLKRLHGEALQLIANVCKMRKLLC